MVGHAPLSVRLLSDVFFFKSPFYMILFCVANPTSLTKPFRVVKTHLFRGGLWFGGTGQPFCEGPKGGETFAGP